MTIHIPRWAAVLVALVAAAGVGFALAVVLTTDDDDAGTSSAAEATTSSTEPSPPCSKSEALAAAKSVGLELTGERELAAAIGKQFGMHVAGVECTDLALDDADEMFVQLACCTASTPDPWAIFTPEDGKWRPMFIRAGINAHGVEIEGGELTEKIPVYGPGDPSATPRGSKLVRFEVQEDGTVDYRPPKLPDDVTLTAGGEIGVAEAGPFDAGLHGPADARGMFSDPTTIAEDGGESCDFEWAELGLTILFVDLGGANACEEGAAQRIRAGGFVAELVGWHTPAGLAVGDPPSKLFKLYPSAERTINQDEFSRAEVFSLKTQFSPYGDAGEIPAMSAEVLHGRVVALVLHPVAGGD